jgi:hypothetical protein
MTTDDEAKYTEQERKVAKRLAADDPDYQDTSFNNVS